MNCIVIHGCPSNKEKSLSSETRTYDKHWIPWITRKLNAAGIATAAPLMPHPWEPIYEEFKAEFEKQHVDEDTILIGHSCGCAFLVRWLGDSKRIVKKLILVAPWKHYDSSNELKKQFYGFEIDETIKDRVDEIIMFTADDEDPEGKTSLKKYHKAIGGQTILLPKHGHYCQRDMGTEAFPELFDAATQTVTKERRVALIVFYDNGKILLQNRKSMSKAGEEWGFFGGGIDEGETSEEAVIRETKEELEHELTDYRFYKTYTIRTSAKIVYGDVYLSPLKDKMDSFNLHEGDGMRLFTIDEAMKLKLVPGDYQVLDDLREVVQQ